MVCGLKGGGGERGQVEVGKGEGKWVKGFSAVLIGLAG
jgi:hypothetical protein